MSFPDTPRDKIGIQLADIRSLAAIIMIARLEDDDDVCQDDIDQVVWIIRRKALKAHLLLNEHWKVVVPKIAEAS